MYTFKKLGSVIVAFMLLVLCSCSNADGAEVESNRVSPTYLPATYDRNIKGSDV